VETIGSVGKKYSNVDTLMRYIVRLFFFCLLPNCKVQIHVWEDQTKFCSIYELTSVALFICSTCLL
jgi:hypothetical protein